MTQFLFAIFIIMIWNNLSYAGEFNWATINPELADATYVGNNNKCFECHEAYMIEYNKSAHARAADTMKRGDCESCHGPLSKHIESPKRLPPLAVSFKKSRGLTSNQKNSVCLQCHEKGKVSLWKGAPHDRADLACSDCHNIQKGLLRTLTKQNSTELCMKCHTEYRAKMQKSPHMPIREGKVFCTSCHNPHGTYTDKLVSAKSVNDKCYECHTDKRGPFLWEHQPVRENCLTCHDPHGTNLETLLKSKPPYLCQQCHSTPGHRTLLHNGNSLPGESEFGSNGRFLLNKGCTNCHSQIHGSNHPSGARFQR